MSLSFPGTVPLHPGKAANASHDGGVLSIPHACSIRSLFIHALGRVRRSGSCLPACPQLHPTSPCQNHKQQQPQQWRQRTHPPAKARPSTHRGKKRPQGERCSQGHPAHRASREILQCLCSTQCQCRNSGGHCRDVFIGHCCPSGVQFAGKRMGEIGRGIPQLGPDLVLAILV